MASIVAADTFDTYVKRVSQRSTESRGLSPGTPVSSQSLTDPSHVAVLRDQIWVVRSLSDPEALLESL